MTGSVQGIQICITVL